MKILITGDISAWNIKDFDVNKINKNMLNIIQEKDLVVYNLEGLIKDLDQFEDLRIRTDRLKDYLFKIILKITKKEQPIVYSDKRIFSLLKTNKHTVVTLANNHVKDLGKKGFRNTLSLLKNNSIMFLGAALNLIEASKHLEFGNIAFININLVAAKKFDVPLYLYNATKTDYGGSFVDNSDLKNKINALKKENKKVILIIHGGKELPKSNKEIGIDLDKVKSLRADITIIHHPHIYIKTEYEKYNIYILGDFIFSRPNYLDVDRKSAFVEIDVADKNIKSNITSFNINEVYTYD